MQKREKAILACACVTLFIGIGGLYAINAPKASSGENSGLKRLLHKENPYRIERVDITPNSTYSALMEQAGIERAVADAIFSAANEVYDLSKIRAGRTLDLYFGKGTGNLEKLVYQIDSEEEVHVMPNPSPQPSPAGRGGLNASTLPQGEGDPIAIGSGEGNWQAQRTPIDYEIKTRKVEGALETSLYEWALKNGVDERAIIEFADTLQWSIDFAHDPQPGDKFAFIVEQRWRDGEYIMPGTVFAGKYRNVAKEHLAFYFEESADNKGYFDAEGNSLQKMFLKAPVAYKYISSGFTTGLRYVQKFNVATGHRAIDYAASHGTPVRTTANGTVSFAGRNGPYGNFITVRHNGTYSTNYAHLSRLAVRAGQKVAQGETVGFVGSTGFSTGPHLHYEMVKYGEKINPLLEVLPPGKPIAPENRERFLKTIEPYLKMFSSPFEGED